jgi:hypothetical protein
MRPSVRHSGRQLIGDRSGLDPEHPGGHRGAGRPMAPKAKVKSGTLTLS